MIGIIVAAHEAYALELVKAAELIAGAQPQVIPISFVPGENQKNLFEKYNAALNSFTDVTGVLFLCDLFGGSPFNAAGLLAAQRVDMDVVTGLNLPMLLGVYEVRSNRQLQEVVKAAILAGIAGVRSLK
ncbi:PTS mannose transporter subunit IID [Alicyclobacillaceae bacterium I2511]|nr:PTS mannose transporter subunit IID [Alicyclobacillaceae bacterium I2511]